ncbi:MAG: tRNA pseudouridine55 synthase [Rhodospirillaceae bacterium]|jgi:tRNA pseudouridine55 synthase|nr:tRNA pseudouridine55 synthase [Rhodospirillaceae bacterium]
MRSKRRGAKVDGWVVLDKPAGMTSTSAVAAVRRAFDAAKGGHGGTLDPLATGLLPIALGEATKTVPYVMDGLKTYRFTLRFGEERATDDAEGAVTVTSDARPSDAAIRDALAGFRGRISQRPPSFSAIKVDGQRAYDLARAGEPVELAAREVLIERFDLTERPDADQASFEVRSGKGAYMRSLARDLARAVGSVGHVTALRRIAVGPFSEAHAISLDSLQGLGHSPAASRHLLPVSTALDDIPALAITDSEASRLRCGQSVGPIRRQDLERIGQFGSGAIFCARTGGLPVALVRLEAGDLRPVRVLNL